MLGGALTLIRVSAVRASVFAALTVTAKVQAPFSRARRTPSIVRDTVPEFETPKTKLSGGRSLDEVAGELQRLHRLETAVPSLSSCKWRAASAAADSCRRSRS